MTQDNDRNENSEQSNDSVEENHMINTNKIIEENTGKPVTAPVTRDDTGGDDERTSTQLRH